MAFVRFSRDTRGYEHIYLIQPSPARGKPSRPRVLYWFRTPPGVKVGREPFDEAARRALEAQNPELTFDWKTLLTMAATPPPDVEHWRERRRAERAVKQARLAAERGQTAVPDEAATPDDDDVEVGESDVPLEDADDPQLSAAGPSVTAIGDKPPAATGGAEGRAEERRRPRRRGGRRRKRRAKSGNAAGTSQAAAPGGSPDVGENVEPAPSTTPRDVSKEE